MKDRARVRSQLYGALAHAFRRPEPASEDGGEDSLPHSLHQAAVAVDREALAPLATEVVQALELGGSDVEQTLLGLEVEYNRLFVGPGQPQAPPYESVYRGSRGLVMGPPAQDAVQRYAEAGLAVLPDFRDLPDHVATELGFMAYLTWQEAAAGSDGGAIWRERERGFLAEHLEVWLPRFCRRVKDASRHPFYTAVADLTLTFVSLDLQELADG